MFTSQEINAHKSDQKDWHNFVRFREAEIAFSFFPDFKFHLALELGAGDGGQSVTISKYCDKLICTEKDERSHVWLGQTILQRKLPNVDYRLCDAQDLSQFDDHMFDLIFSSNMLEHIPDVNKCIAECRRVLSDDGVMLHIMPNRWWKLFSLGLSLLKLRRPRIHGVGRSQWQEFRAFGLNKWRELFERNDLFVVDIVAFPFYVGHGNSFIPIIKAGNISGIPASYLYIVKKKLLTPSPTGQRFPHCSRRKNLSSVFNVSASNPLMITLFRSVNSRLRHAC